MQAQRVTSLEQDFLQKEVKRTLMELADEFDKQQRDIRIAKTGFASVGGLVLAPFTAGVSLIAAVGGLAGRALSGAGTLVTNVAEKIINSMKLKAAQKAIRRISEFYSHCSSVEGETSGPLAAATGIITTVVPLLPTVLIGLNIVEIVSNSIKIDKKSPSEIAEQIRAIARMLD